MAEYRFHEIGDYFANTHAVQKSDNCWAAFIFFERRADASKTLSPGMRHHLQHDFETEGEAIEAGIQYAWECVKKGETGL